MKYLKNLIIPPQYLYKQKTLLYWILLGLGFRFLLMPISYHPDLIEPYWIAHQIVDNHNFNLGQFIEARFNVSGGSYLSFLGYMHGLFYLVFKPFLPPVHQLWLQDHNLVGFFADTIGLHYKAIISFASAPNICSILFLFKLPYLFFDFLCAFLLLHILKEPKKGLFAFKFWMLNFPSLFVIYIMGKYEIIPIFFILLSLFYAKKDKRLLCLLVLGLSIISKFYSLLFLLPFILLLGKSVKERFIFLFWGLWPFLLFFIFVEISTFTSFGAHFINFTQEGLKGQVDFIFSKMILLSGGRDIIIYVFPLCYTIVLWFCFSVKIVSRDILVKTCLIILLLFYATCYFNRQYFIWMMPFLALLLPYKKELIWPHIIQVLCFVIFRLDGGLFIPKLFLPLNPTLIQTSFHPPAGLRQILHPFRDLVLDGARSVFSATCLWMVYIIFKDINQEKEAIFDE